MLKTPTEWAAEFKVRILDPDGWRMKDAPAWDQPISREEFSWRLNLCTIMDVKE